jgi:hypothetical protein
MLKSIDILIGLAVVMLLLSMIVTAFTQFVTTLLNSRGKPLLQRIADILEQIHPGAGAGIRLEIAGAILLAVSEERVGTLEMLGENGRCHEMAISCSGPPLT